MRWVAHKNLCLKGFDQVDGRLDVYFAQSDLHTFLVLAERYDNPAASVTNNYASYARQVCDAFALDRSRVICFECYRDPASPHAYPYYERENITLNHISHMLQSSTAHPRWRPVDDALRETVLNTLIDQHELTYSYRKIEETPGPSRKREPLT